MSGIKKLILSISICIVFLMSIVIGVAGSCYSNSTPVSQNKILLSTHPEIQYTFEPNTLAVQKGGSEIEFEYKPENNVRATSVAYEYVFINTMDTEMAINIKAIDTTEVNVSYHISRFQLDKNTVTASSSKFEIPKLSSYGEKVYIYIIVSPINASIPASFTSSVVWYQGVSGTVTYIVNGTSIKQEIVKGQTLTPPEMQAVAGYELAYYADDAKINELDLSSYRSQGGTVYVSVKQTNSLVFSYVSSNGGYYTVSGRGEDNSSNIVIPSIWNDGTNGEHPVTEINSSVFGLRGDITRVVIPSTITKIGAWAFQYSGALEIIFEETSCYWEVDGKYMYVNNPEGNANSLGTKHYENAWVKTEYQTLPTEWLQLSGTGNYYTVVDGTQYGGNVEDLPNNLVIPSEYNGVPVTTIGSSAFAPYSSSAGDYAPVKVFDSIIFPKTIITICRGSFYGQRVSITMLDNENEWLVEDSGQIYIFPASSAASYATYVIYGIPYSSWSKLSVGNLPEKWLKLSSDGKYYKVVNGTDRGGNSYELPSNLIIPSEYNGLPVTTIEAYAFVLSYNYEPVAYFSSIIIPKSITTIYTGAFYGQVNTITMLDTLSPWKGESGGYTDILSTDQVADYSKGDTNAITYTYFTKFPEGKFPEEWLKLSADGTYYSIVNAIDYGGSSYGLPSVLVIPSRYNNRPVTTIDTNAFIFSYSYEPVAIFSSIIIPSSITKICRGAFYGQTCDMIMMDSQSMWRAEADGYVDTFSASTAILYSTYHPGGTIPYSYWTKI